MITGRVDPNNDRTIREPPMPTRINVKCDGDSGTFHIGKTKDTIVFGTSGNCTFTSFKFAGEPPPPPGFSNRQPPSGGGKTISYDYDGITPIPPTGYAFEYATDKPILGNGTGVIKP
jgi:hypothetical protein